MSVRKAVAVCLLVSVLGAVDTAQAAFPGQNGKIAFGLNDGIHTAGPSGSPVAQVTTAAAPGADNRPEWSPDGTRIAFARQTGGCSPCRDDIWVVNADGTAPTQLTSGVEFDYAPIWSPDGSKIAFQRFPDLWVMNADGSGQTLLTTQTPGKASWSPDGTKIAFASTRRVGSAEIYTIHPDGTGLQRLTTVTANECDAIYDRTSDPEWSPDGQRIVYIFSIDVFGCPEDPRPSDGMRIMKADGTGDTLFVAPDQSAVLAVPSWAPDGTRVAFERDGSTFLVDADGGPETFVPGTGWSPDWQSIPVNAYVRPKGATPIYASLVPAYAPCLAPNRTHGPALAFASCSPPAQTSGALTVGTADSNGKPAQTIGAVVLHTLVGNPATPADEADVRLKVRIRDVRERISLTQYTGDLEARAALQITDKLNTPHPGGPGAGTASSFAYSFMVPCSAGACSLDTSADALAPGAVVERARAVWQLGPIEIYDDQAQLFMRQGIFIP